MKNVNRSELLFEKVSGNYTCPHWVPPQVAKKIASSCQKELDEDAAKALAEIAENFALSILNKCSSNSPTKKEIRETVNQIALV